VNPEKGVIELTARKTSRMMSIPIAPALRKHIESMTLGADRLSPLHPKAFEIVDKQGKSGHLSNQFAAILAKAGLREKKAHRRTGVGRGGKRDESGLSFHSLRHTAVTLLKEAGVPHAVVQELIGHDSEQMSEHYTHVGSEALKKAASALPDVTA
jgi:integrase